MRFDFFFRHNVKDKLNTLAEKMKDHEVEQPIDEEEQNLIKDKIQFFDHLSVPRSFSVGAVDGSGDYPSLTYGDAFVYFSIAQSVVFQTDSISQLKEVPPENQPIIEFSFIPEDQPHRDQAYFDTFSNFVDMKVKDVIQQSDYRIFKNQATNKPHTPDLLFEKVILPHAADSGNIGIQLRSTAELGAALQVIASDNCPDYFLIDTTLSLPFVTRTDASLFFEHVKRLCCKTATNKGKKLLAFSKSHGLPSVESLENLAREKANLDEGEIAENWYLRFPLKDEDWKLTLAKGRYIPPIGSVSYLVRFSKQTPVYRVDMDYNYWNTHVRTENEEETIANEKKIFEDLDFISRDQRCYGYPYPIKAAHDRASLTNQERIALKKHIIDQAVKAGMKRSLFKDVAVMTGHD